MTSAFKLAVVDCGEDVDTGNNSGVTISVARGGCVLSLSSLGEVSSTSVRPDIETTILSDFPGLL